MQTARGYAPMSEPKFQQSYPPPPPWYKTVVDEPRKVPALPTKTFTCFGWAREPIDSKRSEAGVHAPLDTETKLYDESKGLKNEFLRLFEVLVKESVNFVQLLSETGYTSSSISGPIQQILKLHKNLQHILVLLRYCEAKQELIDRFSRQLEHRKLLLSELSAVLDLREF